MGNINSSDPSYQQRVIDQYRPDMDRLLDLFQKEKYEKMVDEYGKWTNQHKRSRKPFPSPIHIPSACTAEYEFDFCRLICWLEFNDLFSNQLDFDNGMDELYNSPYSSGTGLSAIWKALKGEEESYKERFSFALEYSEVELLGKIQDSQKNAMIFLADALRFDRHDRIEFIYNSVWSRITEIRNKDVDYYGEKYANPSNLLPFEIRDAFMQAAMLWVRARKENSKDIAKQAYESFYKSFYLFIMGKNRDRSDVGSLESIWGMAVAWEFDLIPDFDWDKWIADFQYHSMRYLPWRNHIRENNLEMSPLDVSMMPSRDRVLEFIHKYAT